MAGGGGLVVREFGCQGAWKQDKGAAHFPQIADLRELQGDTFHERPEWL